MTQPTVLIAIKKFFFLLLFSLMGLSLCFHAPLFEKNWEGVEQTWGGFEVNSEKKKNHSNQSTVPKTVYFCKVFFQLINR